MHHTRRDTDGGFYMVEVMVAIMIITLVLAVVATSFGAITGHAGEAGCGADARVLSMAAETYLAAPGARELPADGLSPDRYELGLVAEGLLQTRSELYDLDAGGALVPAPSSPCGS